MFLAQVADMYNSLNNLGVPTAWIVNTLRINCSKVRLDFVDEIGHAEEGLEETPHGNCEQRPEILNASFVRERVP